MSHSDIPHTDIPHTGIPHTATGPATDAAASGPVQVYRRPFATARTVFALIMREMATTYGRSPGGYVWAVLEPVGAILLMSLAFSLALRKPPLGSNFMYFYASGYLIYNAYQQFTTRTMSSIRYSRSLLAYPAVTYIDAIIARLILAVVTHALVMIIVIGAIIVTLDIPVILQPGYLLLAFAMATGLAVGIGTLNCAMMGLFPVWEQVWGVLTRPLFLLSGVFFVFESLDSQVQAIFWYNPLIHVIGTMRAGMFVIYDPHYVSYAYVWGISLTTLVIGLILLNRYHREIINGR